MQWRNMSFFPMKMTVYLFSETKDNTDEQQWSGVPNCEA